MSTSRLASVRVLSVAILAGGRFVVLGDDDGHLTVVNRFSSSVLWRYRVHGTPVCAVRAVGDGLDERIVSIDRRGDCVITDALSGGRVDGWRWLDCPRQAHDHLLEVFWDQTHLALSCLTPPPPSLIALVDGAATRGVAVNVHPSADVVALLDVVGRECGRAELPRPLAAGRSGRVAYLRAPDMWVGVRDLSTGEEMQACEYFYERGGYSVAFSADEKWVAWSGYEKYLYRDEREFVRLVGLDSAETHGSDVLWGDVEFSYLLFSETSEVLLAGDAGGAVTAVPLTEHGGPARLLGAVADGIAGMAFTDDGGVVAVGATGEICAWLLD